MRWEARTIYKEIDVRTVFAVMCAMQIDGVKDILTTSDDMTIIHLAGGAERYIPCKVMAASPSKIVLDVPEISPSLVLEPVPPGHSGSSIKFSGMHWEDWVVTSR